MTASNINQFFEKNFHIIEGISKRVLKGKHKEGISSYYIYLYNKSVIPKNIYTNCYYYMVNMSKPKSEINYVPLVLRGDLEGVQISENEEAKWNLEIDLNDERLVDFLLNNQQNDKWIKIYQIYHEKRIKLDLFEEIVFDYVFNQGLSIRDIAKITGNSSSWCYRYRKSLIEKIRKAISEDSKREEM